MNDLDDVFCPGFDSSNRLVGSFGTEQTGFNGDLTGLSNNVDAVAFDDLSQSCAASSAAFASYVSLMVSMI